MRQLLRRTTAVLLAQAALIFAQAANAEEPLALHRYADDRLPPPQARVQLLLTGAALTGLSYLPALGSSYLWPDHPGAKDLRIPVAGPWMMIGRTKLCDKDPNAPATCQDSLRVVGAVFAAFSGIAQAGGVFLMTESLFMKTAPLAPTAVVQTGPYAYSTLPYAWKTKEADSTLLLPPKTFAIAPVPYSSDLVDVGLALSGTF